MSARSGCTSRSPGASALPSGLRKIFAEAGQRASRVCARGQRIRDVVFDRNAVARERDGRRDQVREREFAGAVFLVRQRKPRDGAGHADRRAREVARLLRIGIAVGVEEGLGVDRRRRGLAIIDRRCHPAAVGAVDHHEAAAADIAGARIGHRHGEADRDRGIDRIAAALAEYRRRCAPRALSCATTMPCCAVTACAGAMIAMRRGASCATAGDNSVSATKVAKKAEDKRDIDESPGCALDEP